MLNTLGMIKKAAIDAVEAEKPCGVYFGTVTGEKPINIQIEQNLTLTEPFLVFASTAPAQYKTGDRLILLRMQGGQRFVVMAAVL